MKIKKILVMFLIIMCGFTMIACGYKDVSLSELSDKVLSVTDESKFVLGDSKTLRRYYGLNSNDYDEVCIYTPSSTMEVSELLIIKMKDSSSQADAIEASIDSRIQKQSDNFRDYAPEQYGIVQNYEISIKGNYVFFAISEDAHDMKKEFKDYIK